MQSPFAKCSLQSYHGVDVREAEPEAWQEAAHFGDTLLWLTAEELRELGREEEALMDRYLERQTRPELRPAGTRLVTHLHLAFPSQRAGSTEPGDGRHD